LGGLALAEDGKKDEKGFGPAEDPRDLFGQPG
jgi:hypothetical protein